MNDPILVRLAAANPVPADHAPVRATRARPRVRRLVVAAVILAVVAPAAAFAHRLGDLLGISNEGTPVATGSVLPGETKLDEAMRELKFPAQVQELGTLNGVTFTATRNADGHLCITIDAASSSGHWGRGVGCDFRDRFPQTAKLFRFPLVEGYQGFLRGVAADGVARVAVLDARGNVIASTPVVDNLYAGDDLPQGDAVSVAALDASGKVIFSEPLRPAGTPTR